MADTANFGWTKPTVGADADTWGTTLNALFDDVDADLLTMLPKAGGTMTGALYTFASAVGGAGLRVPHGAAPTSPVNGDVWTTTSGIFARINGATIQPLTSVNNSNWSGTELAIANGGTGATTAAAARLTPRSGRCKAPTPRLGTDKEPRNADL